jgi:hypothetical protein
MAFLTQNKDKLCKIFIITLVWKKTPIFSPKIVENRENCDHNIDPWESCYDVKQEQSAILNFPLPPPLVVQQKKNFFE